MMMLTHGMAQGVTNIADMAWEVKCRQEDMRQRAVDNERRAIDDARETGARRSVDEKAEQLKAVSHLSALIAGFAMVVMVEIALPRQISFFLLMTYSITSSLVVGLMLLSMLSCTMILVAILKFLDFWLTRCESDWRFAYRCFEIAIPLFMAVLAQIGWIIFQQYSSRQHYSRHHGLSRDLPASAIMVVAAFCLVLWYCHTSPKWSHYNMRASEKLTV